MSAALELALLSLYATRNGVELDTEQQNQLGIRKPLPPLEEALETVVAAAESEATIDRFAVAQAFHIGVTLRREALENRLQELGAALLRSVGSDTARVAGRVDPARTLVDAVKRLSPEEGVNDEVVEELLSAFGPQLQTTGSVAGNDLEISGFAAWLAMLLLELFTNGLECTTTPGEVDVGGKKKAVTFVEVDVCTNQPFSRCKRGIDPTHWPDCNPFFLSVGLVGDKTYLPDGWAGVIKEKVGCPFNGLVYETDLSVRILEGSGVSTVAFELANPRTDPGLVTVDRGFLSATDEGLHRRIRVLKVYRIEKFELPHKFLCPIWASQVVMAPWWCP